MCIFASDLYRTQMKDKKKIIIAAVCLAALGVVAALLGVPYFMSGAPCDGLIKIRKGASVESVCDSIRAEVDNDYADRVETLLKLTGSDLSKRQGAFKIKEGMSVYHAMRLLRNGDECGVRFTFNNVRTKEEFASRFSAKFMVEKDTLLAALNDPKLCAKYGRTPDNITGMLWPDTYEFFWDVTPEQLLDRFNDFYNKFWTEERLAKAKALGLTPQQLEVIASITEEETIKSDERGKVARLYINRVQQGMMLQADPTVKFALGDFSIRRLTHAMTEVDSPWNTYRVKGLPPGPIRLPEKKTIEAALNSRAHDYIYMCAKEDFSGYHNFAVDYGTHMANARRYQAELNRRNIK